jgi:SAM-dependent methyltransferase
MSTATQPTYVFEHTVAEHERLVRQGTLFDPITERVLTAAGVRPGMRVLDLGSGAGNVALLAARMVGPGGSVVGVDRDPYAVALARDRAEDEGVDNVRFVVGDLAVPELPHGRFDAVVGRLLLMYLADPAATLHEAALRLRPGGLLCMHEIALSGPAVWPPAPLWQRVQATIASTLTRAGADPRMGLRLHRAFRDAGLPAPELLAEVPLGAGDGAPVWAYADVLRGIAPLMERLGINGVEEARSPTLEDRLRAELRERDAVLALPPMVGAWTRMPGG